jgi:hypothetical protein
MVEQLIWLFSVGVQSNDFGRDDCLDQIRRQRAAMPPPRR